MHNEDIGSDEEDDEEDVLAEYVESVPSDSGWSDARDGVL